MKKNMNYVLILLIIFLTSSIISYAQNTSEEAVKVVLNNLISYSKSKAYDKASSLIAYDGEDKNRFQKEGFNPSNKDELNQVKRICKKISALLDLSSKHEFAGFNTTTINGRENFTVEVNFVSGEQKLATSFKFIKSEKGILLISMN